MGDYRGPFGLILPFADPVLYEHQGFAVSADLLVGHGGEGLEVVSELAGVTLDDEGKLPPFPGRS